MSAIRPDEIAGIRAAAELLLPNPSTIARTSAAEPCRVSPDTRALRIDGLPFFMQMQRWQLVFRTVADVIPGDIITTPTMGTFHVLEVLAPKSFETTLRVYALRILGPDGAFRDFTTNEIVTFKQAGHADQTVTVAAFIVDRSQEPQYADLTLQYPWTVTFPTLRYPNGTEIRADDQMTWTRLGTNPVTGEARTTAILRPRPHPILPIATADIKDKP
jgi:hypothetical protein